MDEDEGDGNGEGDPSPTWGSDIGALHGVDDTRWLAHFPFFCRASHDRGTRTVQFRLGSVGCGGVLGAYLLIAAYYN